MQWGFSFECRQKTFCHRATLALQYYKRKILPAILYCYNGELKQLQKAGPAGPMQVKPGWKKKQECLQTYLVIHSVLNVGNVYLYSILESMRPSAAGP